MYLIKRMRIEDIGEFRLIDRIRKSVRTDGTVVKGIGDDCAVVEGGGENYTLLTSDMIVAGVDFKPGESPRLIGRKALAVSVSDIAACGGIPRYALVSIGLPKRFPVKAVDAIYGGMQKLAGEYGVNIVGGDISRSPQLTIDLSLHGVVEKKNLVLRSGAKDGDVIFVTGAFGGSIKGKHLRFAPRLKEARFLVEHFKVNAMIDCSDGLAQDLRHILAASRVGCVIFEGLIPLSGACRGIDDALYSGEDFELIFTVAAKDASRLMSVKEHDFIPIGNVSAARWGARIIGKKGVSRELSERGWSHF